MWCAIINVACGFLLLAQVRPEMPCIYTSILHNSYSTQLAAMHYAKRKLVIRNRGDVSRSPRQRARTLV